MLYLGCPVWTHPQWKNHIYNSELLQTGSLANYSRYFNTVEGNTSFYADPSAQTLERWRQQSGEDFRFTLKVPQRLSHHFQHFQAAELQQWLDLISPLQQQLAFIHLQLPARFSPAHFAWLKQMLQGMHQVKVAVEVRHPAFFDKAEHEVTLNRLLRDMQAERVIFDSRALFSVAPTTAALADAQRKKPYLPVHAIALSPTPMVRFIGVDDAGINQRFYQPWLQKVRQWLDEGKSPYCFFHTPDNLHAPLLAQQFVRDLGIEHPVLALATAVPPQLSLL